MTCEYGSFHEDRMPDDIAQGMEGGPELRVDISEQESGVEERSIRWSRARRRYSLAYGIRENADVRLIEDMFTAHDGAAHGFRVRDWGDFSTSGTCEVTPYDDFLIEVAAIGPDRTAPLLRTIQSGGRVKRRRIYKPRACRFVLAVDGVPLTGGWRLDAARGVVIFDRLPTGACVTWGGVYDVPVRFDAQSFSRVTAFSHAGEVPGIELIELLGDRNCYPENDDDSIRAELGSSDASLEQFSIDVTDFGAFVDGLSL